MLITYFKSFLTLLNSDEEGQTAIEYALVLALIAVVLVLAVAGGMTGVAQDAIDKVTASF